MKKFLSLAVVFALLCQVLSISAFASNSNSPENDYVWLDETYALNVRSDTDGNLLIETYESGVLIRTSTFHKGTNGQIFLTVDSGEQSIFKTVNIADYITKTSTSLAARPNSQRAYDYTGTLFYEPLNLSGTLYQHIMQVYYTYENGNQTSYTINGKKGDLVDTIIGAIIVGLGLTATNPLGAIIASLIGMYFDGNKVSKNFTEELSADNSYYDVKLVDHNTGHTAHADASMHCITASGSPHKGEYYYEGCIPYYEPTIAATLAIYLWGAQDATPLVRTSGDRFP